MLAAGTYFILYKVVQKAETTETLAYGYLSE